MLRIVDSYCIIRIGHCIILHTLPDALVTFGSPGLSQWRYLAADDSLTRDAIIPLGNKLGIVFNKAHARLRRNNMRKI